MLFNSYEFIFAFLPVVVIGFYLINRRARRAAVVWLGVASLFFYGWWDWHLLPLLLSSVTFNYGAGLAMMRADPQTAAGRRRLIVIGAIAANLATLVYFKYTNFAVANINLLLPHPIEISHIVLPIGISFFTFTQIAFLVDCYQQAVREPRFDNYLLFVTYFPHLIAGPILHHEEMMPQFDRGTLGSWQQNVAVGLSTFVIGLFKKVVIADGVAAFAIPVFDAAYQGHAPSMIEAWCGVIAYTFQLYFDFSGYSDMAVGLSRMFGIRLPLNFDSPLKAHSIIEFWQRWHMTLTRYLTAYLYNPLATKIMTWRMEHGYGISRRDLQAPGGFAAVVAVPMFYTMGLAGIWHGAGTQFLVFGLLHASYLTINHAWRIFRGRHARERAGLFGGIITVRNVLLTYVCVLVAHTFFRAGSVPEGLTIIASLIGYNGVVLPQGYAGLLGPLAEPLTNLGVQFAPSMALFSGSTELGYLLLLFGIVWLLPNTQQVMQRYRPALNVRPLSGRAANFFVWRPNAVGVCAIALLALGSILSLSKISVFLYFQF